MKLRYIGFIVCGLLLFSSAFAEQKIVTKNYQDTNGFFVVQFVYDDSFYFQPATIPAGVPHHYAAITVYRVIDGKREKIGSWRGVFTDGKCFEDNLSEIITYAFKQRKEQR
jgi:hypothetical protein